MHSIPLYNNKYLAFKKEALLKKKKQKSIGLSKSFSKSVKILTNARATS